MVKVLSFSFERCFAPFTRHLWKGPLKRDFLDIDLTTSFGVRKLKYTSAMRVIFFLKMFKIETKLRKGKIKIQKLFFVSEIIAAENIAINCPYQEENTCYRQSMGQQTVLQFCISLRETFSTLSVLTVINKYSQATAV